MSKERITAVAFVDPVDFLGRMSEETWRADKHGPTTVGTPSEVHIAQGLVVITPVGEPPEGDEAKSARWRTVRVPLTNVRYWHTERVE